MKKRLITAVVITSLISIQFQNHCVYASINKSVVQNYKTPEHSKEELYQDIFCSLISPYIQKSVSKYYSKYLTDIPTVDPWDYKILSVERPNGYRSFVFVLKIEIIPYVGPHIGVGVDRLTIEVQGAGTVKVKNFKHIRNYELPPNYQNIIKKNWCINIRLVDGIFKLNMGNG